MNKYKALTKITVKLGFLVLMIVGGMGAFYGLVVFLSGGIEKQKTEQEAKYNRDKSTLESLKTQMAKSGEAEKSFASIQQERKSVDYAIDSKAFADWLRGVRGRYHFDPLKWTPATSITSDKPEFSNINYTITVRPHMKFELSAVSDLHIFSFIDELKSASPGLIRIDSLVLKRKNDMDEVLINQMRNGAISYLVDAKIELSWIGVTKKESKEPKTDANAAAPSPRGK